MNSCCRLLVAADFSLFLCALFYGFSYPGYFFCLMVPFCACFTVAEVVAGMSVAFHVCVLTCVCMCVCVYVCMYVCSLTQKLPDILSPNLAGG